MAPTKPQKPAATEKDTEKKQGGVTKAVANKKPVYERYFTAHDAIYRSFVRACTAGLRAPERGPTATQLAGALLGMQGLDEEYLPKEWKRYADANPDVALCIRRSVAELRAPTGESFGVRIDRQTAKMMRYLTVSNPFYGEEGMPDPRMRTNSKKGKQDMKKAAKQQLQKNKRNKADLLLETDESDQDTPSLLVDNACQNLSQSAPQVEPPASEEEQSALLAVMDPRLLGDATHVEVANTNALVIPTTTIGTASYLDAELAHAAYLEAAEREYLANSVLDPVFLQSRGHQSVTSDVAGQDEAVNQDNNGDMQ